MIYILYILYNDLIPKIGQLHRNRFIKTEKWFNWKSMNLDPEKQGDWDFSLSLEDYKLQPEVEGGGGRWNSWTDQRAEFFQDFHNICFFLKIPLRLI